MRNLVSLVLTFIMCIRAAGQVDTTLPPGASPPAFAGNAAQYIAANLNYPEDARDNNISGQVVARFTVSGTGDISDIHVVPSLYPSLDSEVVRVVRMMPKWKPAVVDGKPVRAFFSLPVKFSLEDGDRPASPSRLSPEMAIIADNLASSSMRLAKAADARKYSRPPDWPGHLNNLPPIVIQTETKAEAAALPSHISVLATISKDGLVVKPTLLIYGDRKALKAILTEASKLWSSQTDGPLFTPAIRKRDGEKAACEVIFEFPVTAVVQE